MYLAGPESRADMRRLPVSPQMPIQRECLHAGEIFLLPATPDSLTLVQQLRRLLQQALYPADPPDRADRWLEANLLRQRLHGLRQRLGTEAVLLQALARVIDALELASDWYVDLPRLRAILPGMHTLPAAAPAFSAHRDCWYANPPAQINLWIPLGDYPATQTFVFYPQLFDQPVANDSACFDYSQWRTQVGWQRLQASPDSCYPQALAIPPGEPLGFDCQAGQLLLFSGTHLHQPCANQGAEIRFSLDLRLVSRADQRAGRGAPQVDNASRGSTWPDFIPLEQWR